MRPALLVLVLFAGCLSDDGRKGAATTATDASSSSDGTSDDAEVADPNVCGKCVVEWVRLDECSDANGERCYNCRHYLDPSRVCCWKTDGCPEGVEPEGYAWRECLQPLDRFGVLTCSDEDAWTGDAPGAPACVSVVDGCEDVR